MTLNTGDDEYLKRVTGEGTIWLNIDPYPAQSQN